MPQMPPPTTALSKARRSRVLTGVLTGVFIGVSIGFSSSHDNEKTIARRRHSVRAPVMRLTQLFPYPGAKLHERGLLHHVLDARQRVPALGLANGLDGDDVAHRAGGACHHHHPGRPGHPLLHPMGGEKHGAGVGARQAACWGGWVMKSTVRGWRRVRRTNSSCITTRVCASSAPKGSSISNTFGSST